MPAKILDGRALAEERIAAVRGAVEQRLGSGGRRPSLAVVLVGSDSASQVYVRNKRRAAERAGIHSRDFDLPADVSESELIELVQTLNETPEVDGILVQLPLPAHVDQNRIVNTIDPRKDVDGFHVENVGRLALRQPGLRPCTPRGIMTVLEHAGVNAKGRDTLVVGASNHVGRPMVLELLLAGATVTCCHKFTRDLKFHVERAEILVVAVGKPNIVRGEWIKAGAVVIDVGINRLEDGSLCGDVDFHAASRRAGMITPVPGGVGPMTVATLLENTLLSAIERDKLAEGASNRRALRS